MTDAALAHDLVKAIAGNRWNGKGDMLDRVYDAIQDHLPKQVAAKWTRRRVRALWDKEAAIVQFREMTELAEVAGVEIEQKAELKEARRAHAEYIAKTARIAEILERQDEDFHRPQIEGLRSVVRRVDRTRNS